MTQSDRLDLESDTVAIIGSGAAGVAAANELRANGFSGAIRLFSSEKEMPYDRTSLSKRYLTTAPNLGLLVPENWSEEQGIDLRLGVPVAAVNPLLSTVFTVDGGSCRYDRLVMCTGAYARQVELPGSNLRGVHYLRTADHAADLRSDLVSGGRVVILGAGVIGLEVAASARTLGCDVTVLEAADRVLGRYASPEVAVAVTELHAAHGVAIIVSTSTAAVIGTDGQVTGVTTTRGVHFPADVVVVGVGARPRVELAAAAGLKVADGIVVDAYGRTKDCRIFAAGDCARVVTATSSVRRESWRSAAQQGEIVARNVLGAAEPIVRTASTWSDQYDVSVQAIGTHEADDDRRLFAGTDAAIGFVQLHFSDAKLTGATAFGAGAGRGRALSAVAAILDRGASVPLSALDQSSSLSEVTSALIQLARRAQSSQESDGAEAFP